MVFRRLDLPYYNCSFGRIRSETVEQCFKLHPSFVSSLTKIQFLILEQREYSRFRSFIRTRIHLQIRKYHQENYNSRENETQN